RRRELERMHLFGEHEPDRLAVLERLEQLDPGAVDARAVLQAERSEDRASLVPPIAADDLRRQRLAEPLEHAVHDVEVVEEAAEEALAEGAHDVRVAGADGALDLRGLLASRLCDQ